MRGDDRSQNGDSDGGHRGVGEPPKLGPLDTAGATESHHDRSPDEHEEHHEHDRDRNDCRCEAPVDDGIQCPDTDRIWNGWQARRELARTGLQRSARHSEHRERHHGPQHPSPPFPRQVAVRKEQDRDQDQVAVELPREIVEPHEPLHPTRRCRSPQLRIHGDEDRQHSQRSGGDGREHDPAHSVARSPSHDEHGEGRHNRHRQQTRELRCGCGVDRLPVQHQKYQVGNQARQAERPRADGE